MTSPSQMTTTDCALKDNVKNPKVKAENSSANNALTSANDENNKKRLAVEVVNSQDHKRPKKKSLSRKVDWDYGSDNPFHMKKYVIEDGVEVVQKEPYTIINFFVAKLDHEKKVNTAENDETREKCLEDMLDFHWQFEYFRASCSYTRPKSLVAAVKNNSNKYSVFKRYE
ncbi:hypothetical protein BD408DRAFT_448867 [Parasitella parasitica]|nr:hypothetical protein BD408DRAFT_448867 [Parasitella parasitica]